ncbi:MAG: M48 family metalloprotease [Dehalococcoidales bacterium]|nr:M48 family metalloprotease [Dehalococcoidales bacterium]
MWEQIRSNQIRSMILVILMGALLLAIGYIIGIYFFDSAVAGLIIALVVWGIMNLVAYFQGDSIILNMSGARKIGPQDHPRLYNVVEEMKIASGLEKMPDIYIIDDPALNAFATGRDPQHAAVAITSGLLEKLNRDELQGVIAHEIAHIKNRDILLMLMASILLGSIVILAWYASRILFFSGMTGGRRRSSSSGGGGFQIIILAVGIVLMILAPIIAQIIYFAISRRREYLADASGALYTRYPEGLASALEKLLNSNTQVKSANKATAPMYISNPFYKKGMAINDLFATHPPLADRIRILRAMGGASYADYESAYRKIKGSGVLPASALTASEKVGIRQASAPETAVDTGKKESSEIKDKIERTRETSDLMWRLNNYRTITCENCGTRMRLPPTYKAPLIRCPHCGYVNQV